MGSRSRLIIFCLFLTFFLAEGILRIAGYEAPSFVIPDYYRGVALRPGATGWQQQEGRAYIRINSRGLRGPEYQIPKPSGVFRIAVLGDSFVAAEQVDEEETFMAHLRRNIQKCNAFRGKRIEVIGFGVNGYGTAQELLTLEHVAPEYQPDLVLVAFFSGNDVRDNSPALDRDRVRPFYSLNSQGGLIPPDFSFRERDYYISRQQPWMRMIYSIINYSRVLQLLNEGRSAIAPILSGEKERKRNMGAEAGISTEVFHAPQEKKWKEAWAITEALLREMKQEADRQGVPLGVVSLTSDYQVHPDPGRYAWLQKKLGVKDLFYPDRRLKAMGEAAGIPVLTLVEEMQRYARANHAFLHGFANSRMGEGHWNQEGHRLAGLLISHWLCQMSEKTGQRRQAAQNGVAP